MPRLKNPPTLKESVTAPEVLLLRDRDVAKVLGCSLQHVWRMTKAHKLPQPVKIGRTTRWSLESLRAYLAAGCPDCGGRPKPANPPKEKLVDTEAVEALVELAQTEDAGQ